MDVAIIEIAAARTRTGVPRSIDVAGVRRQRGLVQFEAAAVVAQR